MRGRQLRLPVADQHCACVLPDPPRSRPAGNRLPGPSVAPSAGQALVVWDGLPAHRSRLVRRLYSSPGAGGSPSSGCRLRARSSIRSSTCGATGNTTSYLTTARAISPSSAIMPATPCAVCAGVHRFSAPSGIRQNCHYDMQGSIVRTGCRCTSAARHRRERRHRANGTRRARLKSAQARNVRDLSRRVDGDARAISSAPRCISS